MRVMILTSLVITIILAFSATDAEEGDDVQVHFHLAPGEPGEEEEEARKEDSADYNNDGKNLSPHFISSKMVLNIKSSLMTVKVCLDASLEVTKVHSLTNH